jgi:hypothetical protein
MPETLDFVWAHAVRPHKIAESRDGSTRDLKDIEKQDPHLQVQPRYWVEQQEVSDRLSHKWNKKWLIAFRDITNSTNERTAIFSLLPKAGVGHTNSPDRFEQG